MRARAHKHKHALRHIYMYNMYQSACGALLALSAKCKTSRESFRQVQEITGTQGHTTRKTRQLAPSSSSVSILSLVHARAYTHSLSHTNTSKSCAGFLLSIDKKWNTNTFFFFFFFPLCFSLLRGQEKINKKYNTKVGIVVEKTESKQLLLILLGE